MSTKGMIRVNAIQCPQCKDIIYSRARHDYHACTCKNLSIDGGFDYMHFGWIKKRPKKVVKYIKPTRKELYDDWNYSKNKFGIIRNIK